MGVISKWPVVGYDGTQHVDGVDNVYQAFGCAYWNTSAEAETQQEVRDTYTASNLRLYLSSWTGGAGVDDMIATFRTNGAADTQTITINATGEHEDVTNTDSLVSGDLINLHCDHSAGGHGDEYTVQSFQATLDASTDVPPIMNGGYFSFVLSAWNASGGAAEFAALGAAFSNRSTEADTEYTMRATRTLRDLRMYCSGYTSGTNVVTVRKNQAGGTLTVSVTGTGEWLDTSNTDSFVAGDEVDYGSDGGGSAILFSVWAVEANTSSGIVMASDVSVGTSTEFFMPSSITTSTTELNGQVEAEAAATIQFLFVNCFTYAETRTIRTRKNAANGASSVSVTGTGLFEDTSNTDTLAAEDDLSIQQDAGSSGTNGYLVAVEWETQVGPVVTQPYYVRTGGVPGMRIGRHDGGFGRSW